MIWLEAIRADKALYNALLNDLTTIRSEHLTALERAKSWDDTLRTQGRIEAIDGLVSRITQKERSERDARQREQQRQRFSDDDERDIREHIERITNPAGVRDPGAAQRPNGTLAPDAQHAER